ncbi:conserved protein of unknown function [Cupriavidus taiwanensis]|nr:conserved protein of unknown function [Cupriavidus taiwanensis]
MEGLVARARRGVATLRWNRARPLERVREGMAGHLDIGLGEDLARDRLELGTELRVHAVAADLALDHRHGHRQPVAIEDLAEQHLAGVAAAGNLGARGKAVAIDMDGQQAPAVLGGDVGHRHRGQAQRLAQEVQRLHHPAAVGGADAALVHRIRPQHIAAPRRDGRGVIGQRAGAQAQQRAEAVAIGHLDRLGLVAVGRHRHLETHHRVLGQHLDRTRHAPPDRLQAEAARHRATHAGAEVVQEYHRHALRHARLHPGVEAARLRRDLARQVHHHAGIAVRADLGQFLAGVGKLDAVAHVVERHRDKAHALGLVERHARAAFLHHQHAPRQHFDLADADGLQAGIGNIGGDAQRADAPRGVARAAAVRRRAVVDRHHRQPVLLVDGARLRQQPVAVGLRHLDIAALGLVPAAEQRLESDGIRQPVHLRQDLEAAVEDQPGVGVARLDRAHHAHQAGFLPRALGVGFGGELVRVQGIEEEAAEPPGPQRRDHLVDIEGGPALGRLVDHRRVPRVVAANEPVLGNVLEIRAAFQHLAHADIGKPGGRGRCDLARVEAAVGFDHGDIEGLQRVYRRLGAVVQRDRRHCRSRCRSAGRRLCRGGPDRSKGKRQRSALRQMP